MNYYEILGVNPNDSKEVIEKKYKALVKKYHPDLYKGDDPEYASNMIKQINAAYDVLQFEDRRREYDLSLQKEESPSYSNNYNYAYKNNDEFYSNYDSWKNASYYDLSPEEQYQQLKNRIKDYNNNTQQDTPNYNSDYYKSLRRTIIALIICCIIGLFALFSIFNMLLNTNHNTRTKAAEYFSSTYYTYTYREKSNDTAINFLNNILKYVEKNGTRGGKVPNIYVMQVTTNSSIPLEIIHLEDNSKNSKSAYKESIKRIIDNINNSQNTHVEITKTIVSEDIYYLYLIKNQ